MLASALPAAQEPPRDHDDAEHDEPHCAQHPRDRDQQDGSRVGERFDPRRAEAGQPPDPAGGPDERGRRLDDDG